jgi:hypothetical protein
MPSPFVLVDLFRYLLVIQGQFSYEPGALLLKLGVLDCAIFSLLAELDRSSTRVWRFCHLILLLALLVLLILILGWRIEGRK